jgi:N-acetylglucosamine-6-phosphate deacetylase
MEKLLLKNANTVLPTEKTENVSILIEDGKIAAILSDNSNLDADKVFDLSNDLLCAGFIDIHNHGVVGIDVNSATADDLHRASKFLAQHGVTGWLPSLVPDSDENYTKVIRAIDELMETQEEREPAARVLGVHYEGVFANEKMCGALRPQFFKTFAKGDEVSSLPKLKNKMAVHLTTMAPEVENGIELVKELRKQNWTVSIGHTRADFQTLNQAFEAGAGQITHLFNAMTGVHHRDIGVAGWALMNDKVSCEIIADGHHVARQMLKFAFDCKTADKLVLISDSVSPTGLGDGDFEIWNEKISVTDGRTSNERGSIAGSVITMLDAFKMFQSLDISENEISKMASLNPAKLLGIEQECGSVEIGKQADLVAIDKEGNVKLTLIGGKVAFNNF